MLVFFFLLPFRFCLRKFVHRFRLAEKITLRLVATEIHQHLFLLQCFNALADRV